MRRSSALFGLVLVCFGCGGGGNSGGGSVPSKIEVIGTAPTPGEADQGISQMTGFVDGKPAFLSYVDTNHWTVSVVGESPIDLSTTAFTHAFLITFDNGIVVGGYDGGSFVYQKTASGWVSSSQPGLDAPVLDPVSKELIGDVAGGHAVVDIATNTQAPITLPAGAALYAAKAKWLLYGSSGSFFVLNRGTAAQWQEQPIPGDITNFPVILNASGGVVGNSSDGTTGRAIYWQPSSGVPMVIDSFTGGTVEPGWISPDGTKFLVNVSTDQFRSYLYVNGTKYATANIEGGSTVSELFGFDDAGQFGFGRADTGSDEESLVAVKITYK